MTNPQQNDNLSKIVFCVSFFCHSENENLDWSFLALVFEKSNSTHSSDRELLLSKMTFISHTHCPFDSRRSKQQVLRPQKLQLLFSEVPDSKKQFKKSNDLNHLKTPLINVVTITWIDCLGFLFLKFGLFKLKQLNRPIQAQIYNIQSFSKCWNRVSKN